MRSLTVVLALMVVALNANAQCCTDPNATIIAIEPNDLCSPIVINFGSGGYRLTGADSPVTFDIAATGQAVRIDWTAAGADEAFLCLDRNHNGRIDDGAELFGTATPLQAGGRAPNGFVALAELDDNHDGRIDEHDAIWSQLLLWRDANHDGISQPDELTPVAGSALVAISLDYHWTGRKDTWGNVFRYESQVIVQSAGTQPVPRPVYDVYFRRVP